MSDMYFEESKLWKELDLLNTSKSPGFDETRPVVLKGAKSVILLPSTNRGQKASVTITDQ